MMIRTVCVALLLAGAVAGPATAKDPAKTFVVVNEDVGVPVFPHDIKDRPYTVIGPVKAGVRKATVFSKSSSQAKIYAELWERAEKLGADAVINASYGEAHVSLMSWGKTNATGTAIKFTGAAASVAAPVEAPVEAPVAVPVEAPAEAAPKASAE